MFRLVVSICLFAGLAHAANSSLVIARRLLSREDFAHATSSGLAPEAIAHLYGEPAANAWASACAEVAAEGGTRLPTLGDLFALHRLAYDFSGATFQSYYAARTAGLPAPTRNRILALASRGNLGGIAQGYGIAPPFGMLRDGALRVSSRGMGNGEQTFTDEQLARLRANPYVTIEGVRTGGNGGWRVTYTYPPPGLVATLLEEAFAEMRRAASAPNARSEEAATRIAARFYRRIISIHPLWDGNGRTARLARDWVLAYLGQPPPHSSPSDDLEMSDDELARDLRWAMRRCRFDGLEAR